MGFGSLFSGMLFLGADIDSLKKIEALKMRSLRGEDVSSEVIKTSFRSMVNSNVNLQDAKRNLSPAQYDQVFSYWKANHADTRVLTLTFAEFILANGLMIDTLNNFAPWQLFNGEGRPYIPPANPVSNPLQDYLLKHTDDFNIQIIPHDDGTATQQMELVCLKIIFSDYLLNFLIKNYSYMIESAFQKELHDSELDQYFDSCKDKIFHAYLKRCGTAVLSYVKHTFNDTQQKLFIDAMIANQKGKTGVSDLSYSDVSFPLSTYYDVLFVLINMPHRYTPKNQLVRQFLLSQQKKSMDWAMYQAIHYYDNDPHS